MNLTIRELFDRYGPTLVLGALLVLLVALLPGNAESSRRGVVAGEATDSAIEAGPQTVVDGGGATEPIAGPGGSGGPQGASIAAPRGGARAVPGAGGGGGRPAAGVAPAARPGGPLVNCRPDGRIDGFSLYMPPCLPAFAGDNGGSTYQGVSKDKIVVVRFMSQLNPAFQAFLESIGADDGRAKNDDMDQTLVDYYNLHSETYGRQVVVRTYNATGPDEDETAMRRDATAIAEQHKPFAVFHTLPTSAPGPAFAEELAARGIVCVCTFSQSRSFYRRTAPHVWASPPMLDEHYQALAEYVGKRLAGKPAQYAGELPPGLKINPRKFGLIYVNGVNQSVDPGADEGRRFYEQELARYGVRLSQVVSYTFDFSRSQEQATTLIGKMREAGVSNLLCVCDPLYPIFLTNEATKQQYFPEWLINSVNGPLDTTFFGRAYNQAQWQHAFGIGTQPVPYTEISATSGYRAYHHMHPDAKRGDEGRAINQRQTTIQLLFTGIHLAGPRLTPQSFARGLYGWPRTGGQPKFPLIYYTPESPVQIKDFTEVFWNAQGRGPDEVGHDGLGIILRAEGGRRYPAGQWERKDPKVFTTDGAVFASATPKDAFDHDADGHRHPKGQRCRSCP